MMYPYSVGYGAFGGAPWSQSMAGFDSWSGTATQDLLPVRMWLVSRSRQLAISSPIAAAAIDRMVGGIVGDGLTYIPQTDLDRDINRRWVIASALKRLDAQHRQTFLQMQELACRNWLLSGDVFYIRRDGGGVSSWRAIESDRVQSPYYLASRSDSSLECVNPDTGCRIVDGVELDSDSCPVAYWILKDYIKSPLDVLQDQIERIPAYDDLGRPLVLHLFTPKRPDQYRGTPLLAESIESLHAFTGFIRSVEQAAAFQSSVWGFITSENPTMDETDPMFSRDLDSPIPTVEATEEDKAAGKPTFTLSTDPPTPADLRAQADRMIPEAKRISAGQLWNLKPGEDVKFLQPTNPNTQFGEYIKSQTGMLAASIGLPLQTLSCNYDTTYASARAAVLESNRQFKRYRRFFLEQFVKPVFSQFVFDTLHDGETADLMGTVSQWQAPTNLCLDPTKEIDAWTKAIELGLVTRDEAALALYGHKAVGTPETPDKTVEVEEV